MKMNLSRYAVRLLVFTQLLPSSHQMIQKFCGDDGALCNFANKTVSMVSAASTHYMHMLSDCTLVLLLVVGTVATTASILLSPATG